MPQLNHPTIPGVSHEVPTKDVKRWERSGWVAPAESAKSSEPTKGTDSTTTAPRAAANEKE